MNIGQILVWLIFISLVLFIILMMSARSSKNTTPIGIREENKFVPLTEQQHSIVVVHISDELPVYLYTMLRQLRMFNVEAQIIIVGRACALNSTKATRMSQQYAIKTVAAETLPLTAEHQQFNKQTKLDNSFRGGFWRLASERFLFIQDLMHHYQLHNVFQVESDNMVYVNLQSLLPTLMEHYGQDRIAAPFDRANHIIPSIVFFPTIQTVDDLASFFSANSHKGWNDMDTLGEYQRTKLRNTIKPLPLFGKEYVERYGLRNDEGKHNEFYSQHVNEFQCVFDACALGQYLGGADARNGDGDGPGYFNDGNVFDPRHFEFVWQRDAQNRWIPTMVFENRTVRRIANLHVHSKQLVDFASWDDDD